MALGLGLGTVAFAQFPAQPEPERPNESPIARSMGITQQLGKQIPADLKFTDDNGATVKFGDLLKGRPLLVVPIWYRCQTACAIVTDSIMKTLAKASRANTLVVGLDLDIVMVSIHPKEDSDLARSKKTLILNALTPPNEPADWRPRMEANWHLLTGDDATVHKFVTETLGVKYKYDAVKDLINHPTCTIFVTPEGKVSSYTIGNDFPTKVVESDLAIAAKNEVGDKADQSMMFGCIMLDPATGRFRPVVMNILRLAGIVTIFAVGGLIVTMNIQSKRKPPFGGGDLSVG